MRHKKVALLGDSIFDNEIYVSRGKSVIEQISNVDKKDWQAELLAQDGAVTSDVVQQCSRVNQDVTHLIVSCGGNDAIGFLDVFSEKCSSVFEAMQQLTEIKKIFRKRYKEMLTHIQTLNRDYAVCTIYDSSPGIGETLFTALAIFNDIILIEAFKLGVPVLDLRLTFDQPADYSAISPIEPSEIGGGKIAKTIAYFVENHNFSAKNSVIYS